MVQFGFFYDQSRCTGCQTCTLACKSYHQLAPGPLKFLRIYQYEKGAFPNVRLHVQWIPCYHCEDPACIDVCPNDALYKESKYGAVLLDTEKCDGCRLCYEDCPYGSIVFESDESGVPAFKCDMCIDRLERGEKPVCTLACPMRALDFGPLKELVQSYGDRRDLDDMPDSQNTRPSIVFKPQAGKRRIICYDPEKAMELFMSRDPFPPIFTSTSQIIDTPDGLIGRDRLIIKHGSAKDLLRCTQNDEG